MAEEKPKELSAEEKQIDEVAKQCAGIIAAALVHVGAFSYAAPLFHQASHSPVGPRFLESLMREFGRTFTPGQLGFLYRQELASYLMKLKHELHRQISKKLEASMATGEQVEHMHLESDFLRVVGGAADALSDAALCKVDEIYEAWSQHKQEISMQEMLSTEACANCERREECHKETKKTLN
jgi:hypothetical protein